MANVEDDIPNFDDLTNPSDELAPAETAFEPQVDPLAAEVKPAEPTKPAEPAKPIKQEPEKKSKPGLDALLPILPAAVAIGLPAIALALAVIGFIYYSTAIYLIAIGFIPLALWMGRKTNTVYVVFLACVLAAVLTAVYSLWIEIGRYKFNVKAQEAKQRVGIVLPIEENRGIC